MSASQIRKELHSFIDQADERILKLLYGMMSADKDTNFELTETHKQILDNRLNSPNSNREEGSSWKDVKSRIVKG